MLLIRIDRIVRHYGAIAIFFVFTVGISLVWSGKGMRAQTSLENSIRIADIEIRQKDQSETNRSMLVQLADHDRRMAVIETKLTELIKGNDETHGYIQWVVMGMFTMLGLKAWERFISPGRGSSTEVPLYKRG